MTTSPPALSLWQAKDRNRGLRHTLEKDWRQSDYPGFMHRTAAAFSWQSVNIDTIHHYWRVIAARTIRPSISPSKVVRGQVLSSRLSAHRVADQGT